MGVELHPQQKVDAGEVCVGGCGLGGAGRAKQKLDLTLRAMESQQESFSIFYFEIILDLQKCCKNST